MDVNGQHHPPVTLLQEN